MDSVINLDVMISGYDSKLSQLNDLIVKYELELSTLPRNILYFRAFKEIK